ncbi:MAG: hypothetical protein WD118_11515, partial [Phycisphaeraceae bacterium]
MQLALSGMSYRLFRSGVTVAILALAVAFLVHMLAYGIIGHETQRDAYLELQQSRSLGEQVTRLATIDSRQAAQLGLAKDDADRHAEYRQWGQMDDAAFARARAAASQVRAVNQYFLEMPLAHRLSLIRDVDPQGVLDRLRDQERLDRFVERLDQTRLALPLDDMDAFRQLVQVERPWLLSQVEQLQAGHRAAIAAVRRAYPERSPRELFAEPPADLATTLSGAGFAIDAEQIDAIGDFARRAEDIERLASLVIEPTVRAAVARRTADAPADVSFDGVMR